MKKCLVCGTECVGDLCPEHDRAFWLSPQWTRVADGVSPTAYAKADFVRLMQAERLNQQDPANESIRGTSVQMRNGVPAWTRFRDRGR